MLGESQLPGLKEEILYAWTKFENSNGDQDFNELFINLQDCLQKINSKEDRQILPLVANNFLSSEKFKSYSKSCEMYLDNNIQLIIQLIIDVGSDTNLKNGLIEEIIYPIVDSTDVKRLINVVRQKKYHISFYKDFINLAYDESDNTNREQRVNALLLLTIAYFAYFRIEEPSKHIINNILVLLPQKNKTGFLVSTAFNLRSVIVNDDDYLNTVSAILDLIDDTNMCDCIAGQLGVCFSPKLLCIDKEKLEQWSNATTLKNNRIKLKGPKADLCKNALDIYEDSSNFENFLNENISEFEHLGMQRKMNPEIDNGRLKLSLDKAWNDKSGEDVLKFMNVIFKKFPLSSLPVFVQAVTFIKNRFYVPLNLKETDSYMCLIDTLMDTLETCEEERVLRATALCIESTSPTQLKKEVIDKWISKIIYFLGSLKFKNVIICSAQYAITHFDISFDEIVDKLFFAIESICSSGKESDIIDNIGCINSLFVISLNNERFNEKHDVICNIVKPLSTVFNDVNVSAISSLFVEEVTNKEQISESMKELMRNVLTIDVTDNYKTIRMYSMLTDLFDIVHTKYYEFYSLMLDQVEKAIVRVNDEVLFILLFSTIVEICIKLKSPMQMKDKAEKISNAVPKMSYLIEIGVKHFMYRMNQGFVATPYYPAERDIIFKKGKDAVFGLISSNNNDNNQDECTISATTFFGSNTYSIKMDNSNFESDPSDEKEISLLLTGGKQEDEQCIDNEDSFDKGFSRMKAIISKKEGRNDHDTPLDAKAKELIEKFQNRETGLFMQQRDSQVSESDSDTRSKTSQKSFSINGMNTAIERISETDLLLAKNSTAGSLMYALYEDKDSIEAKVPTNLVKLAEKNLNNISPRECLRIGLVYVGHGQTNQDDILRNSWTDENVTDSYKSFVESIGDIVDLEKHRHFSGKLDTTNFSNGWYHCYFSCERYEVMFHCATLMPTDKKDKQQIYKKRHIGNDNINVIWSENDRDYNPQTITSQFNDAHIIIYPIRNYSDIFRVSIYKKSKNISFGPLITETICSIKALPILARWTAIFADRAVRSGDVAPSMVFRNSVDEMTKNQKNLI